MKVTEFIYPGCPYCRQAAEIIEELRKEKPEFADIEIDVINELEHPEIADCYDYFYTPCFYDGTRLLYEAAPGRSRNEAKAMIGDMFKMAAEI
ncbi:MAG: thioredoxin family protein [Candidatus Limivicinus sp.]|nr:thioredoxin family protein [Clostridiales bacterium]MDY3859467.1 thioredoxin family protein [Candidatus Limivicinus sp.]